MGDKKQAKHASQVREKWQHTLDTFCCAAAPRVGVASSSSSIYMRKALGLTPLTLNQMVFNGGLSVATLSVDETAN